ncbi:MAG: cellulose biosynthesis protein BcsN [Rhizobium sp.]|nr:cellulose biosynthesis protein BcsN [Rhizobium sp.]
MNRNLVMVLALSALHGCNTVEDPFLEDIARTETIAATGNRELPVHLASVSLAGLGETPLSLRQTSSEGATTQTLVWANTTNIPGENMVTVSTASPSSSTLRKGPDRAEISRALRREFPGVAMTIDPVVRRNAYGAYGAASGRLAEGGGCVYAWQVVGRDRDTGRDEPLHVRLRYCHQHLSPEVLVDLMAGLTLRGGMSIRPSHNVDYAYPAPIMTTAVVAKSAGLQTGREMDEAKVTASPSSSNDDVLRSGSSVSIPMPD